jgi:hypothetical protein
VIDKLTSSLTGVAEAEAVANIVETELKQLKNDFTGDTTTASCVFIVTAELFFQYAVLEAELLLLAESYRVFALLLTTSADAVLTGWEVATLE